VNRPVTHTDEARNRTVKRLEWWQPLDSVFPLSQSASGSGSGGSTPSWASTWRFWVGSGLAFAGAVLAVIGYVGRLREVRQPGDPTTRHYPLLFLGVGAGPGRIGHPAVHRSLIGSGPGRLGA